VRAVILKVETAPERGRTWGPFLETPDNFSGPKNILGVQYSRIATKFLSFFKAKF